MQISFPIRRRRLILAGMLAWFSLPSLEARDFHVATHGDDAKSGSASSPFATLQRAQKAVAPGDTVFIHGGTYPMAESQITSRRRGRAQVILLNKSGEKGKPIRYLAWKDERPVFDFSAVKPRDSRVTAFFISASWLHLKGLSVTGVQVTQTGHTQSICFDNEGNHNLYEQLAMHDGQAIGFWLGRGSNNSILNCDAYRNHDYTSENGKGGNVDGFGFHVRQNGTGNVFRGCRAWFNSDDGFDLITTNYPILIENCWAFYNGYNSDFKRLGDANGFKLGGFGTWTEDMLPEKIPRHVIRNSLAVRNGASGFYANHQPGGIDMFNNTAYANRYNFNLLNRDPSNSQDVPGYGHVLKNNLGYKGGKEITHVDASKCELVANSFDLDLKLTDKDFESLELSDLVKPRQPNGELPEISLLRLKPGNPAIDKGVDIGQPFEGKAPDLGAFEFSGP
ncbi:MAG: right-handed parallel beta-helix repeat-containing protein [Verrucomicrobiota bacterium]